MPPAPSAANSHFQSRDIGFSKPGGRARLSVIADDPAPFTTMPQENRRRVSEKNGCRSPMRSGKTHDNV
jgi:hypothetical protein